MTIISFNISNHHLHTKGKWHFHLILFSFHSFKFFILPIILQCNVMYAGLAGLMSLLNFESLCYVLVSYIHIFEELEDYNCCTFLENCMRKTEYNIVSPAVFEEKALGLTSVGLKVFLQKGKHSRSTIFLPKSN